MNWKALGKHLLSGFLVGFLSITSANGIFDWQASGLEQAMGAGIVGALRALQEYVTPTSYVRPVEDGTATATLAAKPPPEAP